MAEINNGTTLFEMSKNILEGQKPYDPIALNKLIKQICEDTINNEYMMLYCRDLSDFTIFRQVTNSLSQYIYDLNDVLSNRGYIIMIEKQDDGAWEIWIRNPATHQDNVYYLFNYSEAIILV